MLCALETIGQVRRKDRLDTSGDKLEVHRPSMLTTFMRTFVWPQNREAAVVKASAVVREALQLADQQMGKQQDWTCGTLQGQLESDGRMRFNALDKLRKAMQNAIIGLRNLSMTYADTSAGAEMKQFANRIADKIDDIGAFTRIRQHDTIDAPHQMLATIPTQVSTLGPSQALPTGQPFALGPQYAPSPEPSHASAHQGQCAPFTASPRAAYLVEPVIAPSSLRTGRDIRCSSVTPELYQSRRFVGSPTKATVSAREAEAEEDTRAEAETEEGAETAAVQHAKKKQIRAGVGVAHNVPFSSISSSLTSDLTGTPCSASTARQRVPPLDLRRHLGVGCTTYRARHLVGAHDIDIDTPPTPQPTRPPPTPPPTPPSTPSSDVSSNEGAHGTSSEDDIISSKHDITSSEDDITSSEDDIASSEDDGASSDDEASTSDCGASSTSDCGASSTGDEWSDAVDGCGPHRHVNVR